MKRHIAILLLLISSIGVAHASSHEYFVGFEPMFFWAAGGELDVYRNDDSAGYHTYFGKGDGTWEPAVGPGLMLRTMYCYRTPYYFINVSNSFGEVQLINDVRIRMTTLEASILFPKDRGAMLAAGPHVGFDWHFAEVRGTDPANLKLKPNNPGFFTGFMVQRFFEKARVGFALDLQFMTYDYEFDEDEFYTFDNGDINLFGFRITVATSFRLFKH